jgi:hypothetical protein
MGTWPVDLIHLPPGPRISTASVFSVYGSLRMIAQDLRTVNPMPAANQAQFVAVELSQGLTVSRAFWFIGSRNIAGTNADAGIYSFDGTRLVSTGSTAMSGNNVVQSASIAATYLPVGRYWLALALSDVTTTIRIASGGRGFPVQSMASALPLPAKATLSQISTHVPLVGFSTFGTV